MTSSDLASPINEPPHCIPVDKAYLLQLAHLSISITNRSKVLRDFASRRISDGPIHLSVKSYFERAVDPRLGYGVLRNVCQICSMLNESYNFWGKLWAALVNRIAIGFSSSTQPHGDGICLGRYPNTLGLPDH